ncbi:hypothetical protein ACQJBY_071434 [Aegilops geniculata]
MASSSSALRMPAVCAVLILLLLTAVSRCEANLLQVTVGGRRMLAGGSNAAAVLSRPTETTAASTMRWAAAGRATAAIPYSESKRSSPGGPDPQHH